MTILSQKTLKKRHYQQITSKNTSKSKNERRRLCITPSNAHPFMEFLQPTV
jgi:hypothetical protein